jgi:hypothetical protein
LDNIPFAETSVQIDDCLATVYLAKPRSISVQHLVSSLWEEASNVDIGDSFSILKALGQGQIGGVGPHGRDGSWNCRLLLNQALEVL